MAEMRRVIAAYRFALVVAVLVIIALVIALAVVVTRHKDHEPRNGQTKPQECPTNEEQIHLEEPKELSPFHDLGKDEIRRLWDYLKAQTDLNIVSPNNINSNSSYVYLAELYPPNKEATLQYLDSNGAQPPREAKVVVFRGDKASPVVEEYIVGPLSDIQYHKPSRTNIAFTFRPLTTPEYNDALDMLTEQVGTVTEKLLMESYGGKMKSCGTKCLAFKIFSCVSPSVTGETTKRKMWFWLFHDLEFFSLHPVDFHVLVDLTGKSKEEYFIDKVVHAGRHYNSLADLMTAYDNDSFKKTTIPFPTPEQAAFSTLNRRGAMFPAKPLRNPVVVEPDGRRYAVHGRHVEYMLWDFHFRMSTISGPQIFDVRYNGERIAYEISLQELSVFYSAGNPAHRFADYADSVALIGALAKTLVPDADCPTHATFISATHMMEGSETPMVVKNAFCLFEQNTGDPLRRHHTYSGRADKVYGGMLDVTLVLRTITTVINYDYIVDFIFHQNGALRVKITSAGYILTSFYTPNELRYGFRLHDNFVGNVHHHVFNFKADIDIKGHSNRHEIIGLQAEELDNTDWSTKPNAKYHQTTMKRTLQTNEKGYEFNFNDPKYFIFYNDAVKNKYGVPKAYRLYQRGMSKQILPPDQGQEPAVSWARYQMSVTKRKESEPRSSSMYAIWDASNPVVNFTSFLNNEVITDQDLVAWVTMGIHHFPHTEDLPTTPTVSLDLDFFLLPYNYFDEDPAMGSANAVRIEPEKQSDVDSGIRIQRYGVPQDDTCVPKPSTYDKYVSENPRTIFE